MRAVTLYFDFVCPYCYIGLSLFERFNEVHNLPLVYNAYELRPEPMQPKPMPDEHRQILQEKLLPIAHAEGLIMREPQLENVPQTQLAFYGMHFAGQTSFAAQQRYVREVLEAYWQHSKDISDLSVIESIVERVSLSAQEFRSRLEIGGFSGEHQEHLRQAQEITKIEVVPTFLWGERRLEGLIDRDLLEKTFKDKSSVTP